MQLSLAVPDWEDRIRRGLSLVPRININPAEQHRAVKMFERLRLPDVPGQPTFEDGCGDWFKEIVGGVLGSIDPETAARIVRGLFLLAPKKSSKTTYGAGMMMTALLMNKRPNGGFLLTGPTHDISEIAYGAAYGMIEADDDWQRQENGQEGYLKKVLHSRDHIKTIEHRNTGASLEIKTFDMDVATGVKPVGVLVDELHIIAKNKNASRVLGQLRGGRISNPEAFFAIITTQSDEPPVGVMATELKKARAIRDGTAHGNTLSVLYEFPLEYVKPVPSGVKPAWYNSKLWPMVTPNLSRSVTIKVLEEEFEEAKQSGDAEIQRWASQHLNIELGLALRSDGWAGAALWLRGVETGLTLEGLLERCEVATVGIDGGGLDDLLGLAVIGREKGTKCWLGWTRAFISPEGLDRRQANRSAYDGFKDAGDLIYVDELPDDVTALVTVVEQVKNSGLLAKVGVDPAGVGVIVDALAEIDVTTEEDENLIGVHQGFGLMGAIKSIERKLVDGTFRHGGQSLMNWCAGNAIVQPTPTGMRIVRDASGFGKIDPLMALFDAAALMALNPPPAKSVYEERGLRFV
jgi:phage terminase large subunit-like protein